MGDGLMLDKQQGVAGESADLWTHGALLDVKYCPCCGSSSIGGRSFRRRDDELAFADVWVYRSCEECDSLYLVNRPDASSLPRAYENYYTHSSSDAMERHGGIVSSLINGYLNARFGMARLPASRIGGVLISAVPPIAFQLNVYGRHVPRSMLGEHCKLLDVGCGNGDFLARASEMGLNAMGCEPDADAVAACLSRGLDVIHGDIDSVALTEDGFHMISMNHVIEHVDDPREVLGKAYRLLRPGGILWLGLPNPQAAGLRVFGSAWKGFHPPFHLSIPTQGVLERWLIEAGFESVRRVRRGVQSRGLWRDSMRIYAREGGKISLRLLGAFKIACDVASTVFPLVSEESILIARKPSA
ncbi:2-polyprenyl-3-methyl-5-hydroxy-6-metoxy-1,4-benzoquinol methylase [Pseudoxanthomonas sp. SORGH_AS 997]|uniref:2-polyprenyl-3-methyl-5-hydroxy-6-metoxy-1, 4-benzoquinol methylase n=2 Tax=Lysobacteraceae TaxID=32033 RepID=A0AAW8GBA2_9GAMM|nr:2-polyprenyl-3-methyl-5-hydroxy-6-metoxy-1,4-benzoquinol methylase [Pseudoxanthomonas winnipegensis]MDQ1132829.1 2-polyprenyl-3-methyl-5-hydroxy-6-metoxy-1,4-benzoquinol methylase [Pseudoxanthomonas winnipegensis]MDR6137164.1 2-polyprenyl-3-methyl-5-hydroxy-6-metoxy-1,4-benzoquinol methylase [Pseudoxanthomonas sp. SORGH_AS_0997]